MKELSREEFFALSPQEIEEMTGVEAPEGDEGLEAYKEKAWESYKLDVRYRDEWGGTEGESTKPPGT